MQPTHFFRYLQVRDFASNHFPDFPALPTPTIVDTVLGVNPNLKGSISILYNTLLKSQTTTSDALCNAWSAELGGHIGPAAWEHALSWVHSSSICACHGVFTVQSDPQSSLV